MLHIQYTIDILPLSFCLEVI